MKDNHHQPSVTAPPTVVPIAELLSITKEAIMKTYDDYEM